MQIASRHAFARTVLRTACITIGLAVMLRMFVRSYWLFRIESVSHDANLMVYAFFMVLLLVSLGVIVALCDKVDALLLESRFAVTAVAVLCAVMYWVACLFLSPAFELATFVGVVIVAAHAVTLALCLCAWGCILSKLDLLQALVALITVPTVLSLLSLVPLVAPMGSKAITGVMALLMVPCCYASFSADSHEEPCAHEGDLKALLTPALVILLCGACACAIASGILSLEDPDRANIEDLMGVFAVSLIVSTSLAVCVATGSSTSQGRLDAIVQLVCTLLVVAVLFIAIGFSLLGSGSGLSTSLLSVARWFCTIGSLVVATRVMQGRELSPSAVLGLMGIVGIVIPQVIRGPVTPVVNLATNDALLQNQEIAILVISGVLIFVAFIMLAPFAEYSTEDAGIVEDQGTSLQDVYDEIALEHGLTPREQEVMQLIAEGNSMRKVGELLFISLGTVQSHAKKIYKKLDIHSRQDLLDLIDRHVTR